MMSMEEKKNIGKKRRRRRLENDGITALMCDVGRRRKKGGKQGSKIYIYKSRLLLEWCTEEGEKIPATMALESRRKRRRLFDDAHSHTQTFSASWEHETPRLYI